MSVATDLKHPGQAVRVLFGSASRAVVEQAVARLQPEPGPPLVLVSEFPVPAGSAKAVEWIPYHIHRTADENRALILDRLAGRAIAKGIVLTEPETPYWALRTLGASIAGLRTEVHNEMGHRTTWARFKWRTARYLDYHFRYEGRIRRTLRGLLRPSEFRLPLLYRKAIAKGRMGRPEAACAHSVQHP